MTIDSTRTGLSNLFHETQEKTREGWKLKSLTEPHAGLLLSRYLRQMDDKHVTAKLLLETTSELTASDDYKFALAQWEKTLAGLPSTITRREMTEGPLAIGLGTASPLEIGLTTHHTYGTPVIPGSALKGLCRRGAQSFFGRENLTEEQQKQVDYLFGKTEDASAFTFHDALYTPQKTGEKMYGRDVITVHHPDYYGKGKVFPTDFDDPNPVSFLIVRPGTAFVFAISAPSAEWGEFALNLLRWSLANLGVGAKTNAGYGRFDIPEMRPPGSEASEASGGGTSPVPQPAVIEDWGVRTILPEKSQGRPVYRIAHRIDGQQYLLEISQSEWDRLNFQLTDAQKKALTNKKLKAKVQVARRGKQIELHSLSDFQVNTGN